MRHANNPRDRAGDGSTEKAPPSRLAYFLTACGGAVRQAGNEHVFRCPCHTRHANSDATPSGSVRIADDGRLLVTCRTGCPTKEIVAAIGWSMADLMPPRTKEAGKAKTAAKAKKAATVYADLDAIASAAAIAKKGKVESTHVYTDGGGNPVFAVVRIRLPDGSKQIPQVKAVANGWVFGGAPKPRPFYALPDILSTNNETPILLFEGEQKADRAKKLGGVATTASQGAGNAKLTDFSALHGRIVHLFPDNDEVGGKHMQDVAKRAYAAGATMVTIVSLSDLPPKGDVVDYWDARQKAGLTDDQIADEIRDAIANATEVPRPAPSDDQATTDDGEANEEDREECDAGGENIADQLVAIGRSAELFHDENKDTYATFTVNGHNETCRIGSLHFSRWLAHSFYIISKKAVPPQAMTTAVAQLGAMALFEGAMKPVYTRVARAGNAMWIDLCNDDWQAIEITDTNWRIVDKPSVRFVRGTGVKSLPTPVAIGDSLDSLFDLLHIEEPDARILITVWLVTSLMSLRSYVVLTITGEQGSGKSTTCRALQRMVDPHLVEGRSPPRGEEDIAVAAQHAHVLQYENMSSISPQISDAFCRVATGAGFAARKLFTDGEERQLVFCRPLIINGIGDLATRSDLADRVVCLHLHPIPRDRRRTEESLWQEFEMLKPPLFGTLLGLIVKVQAMPDLDVPLERMAEFTQIGAKVAIALGLPADAFLDAYRRNRDDSSNSALDSSAIGPVVMRMVRKGRVYQPLKGLLFELNEAADVHEGRHPDWPRTPKGLGNELRRLAPNFARAGVSVKFSPRKKDGCWVAIEERVADDVHQVHHVHPEAEAHGE